MNPHEHLQTTVVHMSTETTAPDGKVVCGQGTGNIVLRNRRGCGITTCGHNVSSFFLPGYKVEFLVKFFGETGRQPAYLLSSKEEADEEVALLMVFGDSENRAYLDLSVAPPELFDSMPVFSSHYSGGYARISKSNGSISRPHVGGWVYQSPELKSLVEYELGTVSGSSGAAVVDVHERMICFHVKGSLTEVEYNEDYATDLAPMQLRCPAPQRTGIPYSRVLLMIYRLSPYTSQLWLNSMQFDIVKAFIKDLQKLDIP